MNVGRRVFLKVYQSGRRGHKSFSFPSEAQVTSDALTVQPDVTLDLMEDREIQRNKQVIADRRESLRHFTWYSIYPLCAIFGDTLLVILYSHFARSRTALRWPSGSKMALKHPVTRRRARSATTARNESRPQPVMDGGQANRNKNAKTPSRKIE